MYNKHNNTIFNYYNTKDNVHGAVIMTKSLQAFIHFSSRLQNSAKWVIHTITQLCIRGFTTMRCIHRLFTYLLTYLLTYYRHQTKLTNSGCKSACRLLSFTENII